MGLELTLLFVNVILLETKPGFLRCSFLSAVCLQVFVQSAKPVQLDLLEEARALPALRGGAHGVNAQLAVMFNPTELDLARGQPCWTCRRSAEWKTSSTCRLRLCPEAAGPARRSTCVLNCQGVIVPCWAFKLLHIYYESKYDQKQKQGGVKAFIGLCSETLRRSSHFVF